jgi:hypothetical protein
MIPNSHATLLFMSILMSDSQHSNQCMTTIISYLRIFLFLQNMDILY